MSWKTKRARLAGEHLVALEPQTLAGPFDLNCGAVIVYEFWAGQIPNFG